MSALMKTLDKMACPSRVGDFVLVGFGDSSSYYRAAIIATDGIYISPVDNPNTFSKLVFDPTKQKWMVFGTTQDLKLEFLSKEKYHELVRPESVLPILFKEPIIEIGGDVWVFGANEKGQLGLGDINNRNTPIHIPNLKAKSVACVFQHTVVINQDNNVWSVGNNRYGQLGLGDNIDRNTPTQILDQKGKSVICGGLHTIIIDQKNNVWSVGDNGDGQLGLGNTTNQNFPAQIPNFKAKFIACGDLYTVIIDLEDNVWSFGNDVEGQLGLGDLGIVDTPTQIPNLKAKYVACGRDHTVVINKEGNTWSFGKHNFGQLGLNLNKQPTALPIFPTGAFTAIPTKIPNLKAKSVACGGNHTVVIS